MKRVLGKPLEPGLKVVDGQLQVDHPDTEVGIALFMEAVGTTDRAFAAGFICQVTNATGKKLDEDSMIRLNFMLSVIRGIKPKDHVEAMLACQMAAVHESTMKFFRNLAESSDDLEYRDSAERTLNKLMRTFTTQMEALKRYRSGVQQTVNVQHVNVNDGGQAIVGNISQGEAKASAPKPLALAHDETLPMPNLETARTPVSAGLKRK